MVTHEAIASAWPRLDGWLDEDAERARLLRIVETAATEWDAGGRQDEDLLRGARLTGVSTWREASDRELTDVETGFLDASAASAEAELRELEERAAHERSRNRVLRGLAVGAAALLVAATAAGGVAVVQGREAAVAAEDQRIEALVATSLSLRSTDLDAAALLAAEAYQRWPDDGRVRSSLWGVLTSAHGLLSKWRFDGAKVAAAVIPGTSTALLVVQGTGDAETAIVDLDTTETLRTFDVDLPSGDFGNNRQVAVSADGSTAVVQTPVLKDPGDPETCCVNHLRFIDLGTGEALPGSGVAPVRTTSMILMEPDGSAAFLGNIVTTDLMRVDSRTGVITASDPRALEDLTGESAHQRDRLGGRGPDRGRGRNGSHRVRRRDPRTPHPPCDPREPRHLGDDLGGRRRRHVRTRRDRPDRRGVGDCGVDRCVARGWRVLVTRTGRRPPHHPVRSERTDHSPLHGDRFCGGTARDAAHRRTPCSRCAPPGTSFSWSTARRSSDPAWMDPVP